MSAVTDARPAAAGFDAPTVLDIEASGFGRGGFPIEIGFVRGDGSAYCTLVRPAASWTFWDPQAAAIHGITRELLVAHGRAIDEVARELNQRLAGDVVYSDAWGNDFVWLSMLFDEVDVVPRFRVDSLRTLLSDREAALWHTTKETVRSELMFARHRASGDAQLLQRTLLRIKNGTS